MTHRNHRQQHGEPPIPPIPPIPPEAPIPPEPPVPPEPPFESRHAHPFRFGDLFAAGRRGWRGSWGPFNFDFDEQGHGWGGGGGDRGRRRMFESGELRLVLLKLIADQPRHGYDLIRAIEDMTGGRYAPSPGIVYPTLTMLQDMGLIEEAAGEGGRKPFQITETGIAHLAENREDVEQLIARLERLNPSHQGEGGSPIWRAMRNLGVAIRHRVARGEITDDTKFEVAALIDELAQKIERLK